MNSAIGSNTWWTFLNMWGDLMKTTSLPPPHTLSLSLSLSIKMLCWCVVERMLFHKKDSHLDHTWHKKVEMRRRTARTFSTFFSLFSPSPCIFSLCIIHSLSEFSWTKELSHTLFFFESTLLLQCFFGGILGKRISSQKQHDLTRIKMQAFWNTQPTWKRGTRLLFPIIFWWRGQIKVTPCTKTRNTHVEDSWTGYMKICNTIIYIYMRE
jgi:hypothetical protein